MATAVPIPESYWVQPGRLMAGHYPGAPLVEQARRKVLKILEAGITFFVDLTEEKELEPYAPILRELAAARGADLVHERMSIHDFSVPTQEKMQKILDVIDQALAAGHVVYVHCWGGRGRTGTVIGCFLVRHGLTGEAALDRVMELRKGTPKGDMPSPENDLQRDMVRTWKGSNGFKGSASSIDAAARFKGALLGLAVGDALGTTLEFKGPGPHGLKDMVGGGPFHLRPGQWTDDTSMALCMATSLVELQAFDAKDHMDRYVRWWKEGYLSCTGHCFDIGGTVISALSRFIQSGDPYAGSEHPKSAGNGSLMRLAPVPLFFAHDPVEAIERSADSSRTTHATRTAVDACRYMAGLIVAAVNGAPKEELLSPRYSPVAGYWDEHPLCPEIDAIAAGSFKEKDPPEIRGTGYVVQSLEAALWAFHRGRDFREGCLLSVNLGEDADTTGAVFGQLAGAYFGEAGIPSEWLAKLHDRERIADLAEKIYKGGR